MTTTTTTGQLRERRRAVGLSQRELARRAGYSLTHIANVEAGIIPHRSSVLTRIHEVLRRAEAGESSDPRNESDPGATPGPTKIEGSHSAADATGT